MGAQTMTQPLTRAGRTAQTRRRASCSRRRRGQRPVAELRAKRYDVPARNARAAPRPGVRSRSVRPDTADYRRRRRVAGLAVAVAVTVLSLGVQAAIAGPDSDPALTFFFTPVFLVPLGVWFLVELVRWSRPARRHPQGRSGNGSWRPASLAPAA